MNIQDALLECKDLDALIKMESNLEKHPAYLTPQISKTISTLKNKFFNRSDIVDKSQELYDWHDKLNREIDKLSKHTTPKRDNFPELLYTALILAIVSCPLLILGCNGSSISLGMAIFCLITAYACSGAFWLTDKSQPGYDGGGI